MNHIFIYASDVAHPYKEPSVRFLEKVALGRLKAVSSAEVLQDILYYWVRKDSVRGLVLIEKIVEIVPLILPVNKNDILKAGGLFGKYPHIEPRDAIHAVVMLNRGLKNICTYDKHFDHLREIKRAES